MSDNYSVIERICLSSKRNILATIIQVDGSSYRKEGTCMVMEENGSHTGIISGGCVEIDLAERLQEILRGKTTCTITYNMKDEDDSSWGEGAGCNGIIKVLLEPVDDQLRNHFQKLKRELDHGNHVTFVKNMTPNLEVTEYLFLSDNNLSFGNWNGPLPSESVVQNQGLIYSPASNGFLYVQHFPPRPNLIIFGAGPDAIPLVKLAAKTGFRVTVADWRPANCNKEYFPEAHQALIGSPSELISQINPSINDYVIIMTHSFSKDQELVKKLISKKLKYLGLLGSKDRSNRLLKDYKVPPWVHYPVGLSIGADGPDEIAVSILAQMIKEKRQSLIKKEITTYEK